MKKTVEIYDAERNLDLELLLPDDCSAENKKPLFLYFHGGGLENGTKGALRDVRTRLTEMGFATASAEYRMYPTAHFPDFIEDCARATAYLERMGLFSYAVLGGSSAGGYLTMMLHLDTHYYADAGVSAGFVRGYVHDAGQPTVHFNVLRERGMDTRLVRIDEAAPLYFITKNYEGEQPLAYIITASQDMYNRPEQLRLLHRTLLHFRYPADRLRFRFMDGYKHCGYLDTPQFFDLCVEAIRDAGK